ncbi:cysteine peptidase family C39 domain-containing protein [[Clostridium] polysaccharolyticum]|uniref:Butirosin biosynthesis protein H, N-terminal n=1 Tax=[Clostridium] polysaccharolyticum TaxID=29364 RepID=A0A1I0C528_9FIRM|nr:hypothetical protein [[Clostridium] polysaccharolyticum]SET14569.1 hypothetical protein SAMN04487772_10928 [[Clostridium] polysaccharolyticum]
MRRKVVLKLDKPIFDVYNYDAFILAILAGNSDNYFSWVFSNYILVKANRDLSKNGDVFLRFADAESIKTELLSRQFLSWSTLSKLNLNINEIVRKLIDLEYYAYFQVDEYYIPHTFSYQREHFVHDILIYGYDIEKQIYYISGYNEEFLFSRKICTFAEFQNALYANKCEKDKVWTDRIRFYKYDHTKQFPLNIKLIKLYLEDYVRAKSTFASYERFNCDKEDVVYGIGVYDVILEHIEQVKKSRSHQEKMRNLDFRIFRFLLEYKKVMLMRLECISKNDIDLGEIFEEYKEECVRSEKTHGLAMRFELLNDTSILDKISRNILEMKKYDSIILEKVIGRLS